MYGYMNMHTINILTVLWSFPFLILIGASLLSFISSNSHSDDVVLVTVGYLFECGRHGSLETTLS